jgi:hypothetical protein
VLRLLDTRSYLACESSQQHLDNQTQILRSLRGERATQAVQSSRDPCPTSTAYVPGGIAFVCDQFAGNSSDFSSSDRLINVNNRQSPISTSTSLSRIPQHTRQTTQHIAHTKSVRPSPFLRFSISLFQSLSCGAEHAVCHPFCRAAVLLDLVHAVCEEVDVRLERLGELGEMGLQS